MKPSYLNSLREAGGEYVRCVFHKAAWLDLATGAIALAFLVLRVVMLLLGPVTVPLAAWYKLGDERARRRAWRRQDRDWMGE